MKQATPEKLLKYLNDSIKGLRLGSSPIELYDPFYYIMSLGGKRIRPLLTLLVYNMFKEDYESACMPALGVEVFHNFSLVHDDVMDEASLRRGKPTVHNKWNENIAILSGDVMLVKAYELIAKVPEVKLLPSVLKRFGATAAEVCEGQQKDMNFESQDFVSEMEYLDMIRQKTAVLLGFSMELGAILAGKEKAISDNIFDIGVKMGLAFQLQDDLLDTYGDDKFGKQIGGDIINNKKTYLMVMAMKLAKGEEEKRKLLVRTALEDDQIISNVKEVFDNLGIKKLTTDKIEELVEESTASLLSLGTDTTQLMDVFAGLRKRVI